MAARAAILILIPFCTGTETRVENGPLDVVVRVGIYPVTRLLRRVQL